MCVSVTMFLSDDIFSASDRSNPIRTVILCAVGMSQLKVEISNYF